MENNNLTDLAFVMAKMATLNDECAHRAVEMASMAYNTEQLNYFYRLRSDLQSLLYAAEFHIQQGRNITQEDWRYIKDCYNNILFCNKQIGEKQQSLFMDFTSMLLEVLQKQCNRK